VRLLEPVTTIEPPAVDDDREMLAVENLHVTFALRGGGLGSGKTTVTAVDGVSFSVARRETLGIVGESGCGKSTMANAIVRLVPFTGRIRLEGTDVTDLRGDALVRFRRRVQLVFQDPYASLNPRLSVRRLVGEPVQFAGRARGEKLSNDAIAARVVELLGLVGLAPDTADRYPHEFSGGQRQRIGLARALSVGPDVILADEPVSALDVSVQAQIINLLVDLQERLGLTLVFIAHDLAVVRHVSDRIAVMYLGRVVELGAADELYTGPLHPYTVALLAAIPIPDPDAQAGRRRLVLTGDAPSPVAIPSGCRFHPRCPIARAEPCSTVDPPLAEVAPGRFVACHFPGELASPEFTPVAANVPSA
jgi:peptide/nickel transport system ATP-binding protein